MESLVELIEKQSFFMGFSTDKIELLVDCASKETVRKGNYIFKTGEDAGKFYLINEGSVSLEINTPDDEIISIQSLEKGEILGWSWQFPPYKWNFDARAIEDTNLIAFDTKCFFETCKVNLLMAYEIQKRFSEIMLKRLQAARIQLIELKSSKT